MSSQSDLSKRIMPPTATENLGAPGQALYQVQSFGITASASNVDWVAALTTAGVTPPGWVYLCLELDSVYAHVRFKPSASAAATTASNGLILLPSNPAGARGAQTYTFYVSPKLHRVIDIIGSGIDTLRVQVCASPSERYDQ